MGTHGRNAITRNRKHICHEQQFDGHDACYDFTSPFLEKGIIPQFDRPTMEDNTDECDHGMNFAHIDYDHKIFYTGEYDPRTFIKTPQTAREKFETVIIGDLDVDAIQDYYGIGPEDEEWDSLIKNLRVSMINLKKIEAMGWRILFEVSECPAKCECPNRGRQ